MHDTLIAHNTAVLTGKGSVAIACSFAFKGDDLRIEGNIVWGERNAATCANGFVEADNIYWASDGHPSVTFDISATSRTVDPRLVDPRHADLRLLSDSPAIDAIRPMDLGGIGDVDPDGIPIPQGYAPDIGAYEYTTAPPPSPTPDPSVLPTPSVAPSPSVSPAVSGPVPGTAPPSSSPAVTPEPTPTPRVTPTPEPPPSPGAVRPPTGGSGALDQLIALVAVVGAGGLLAAVFVARRSPR